jgi:hypothetical protein
MVGLLAAMVSRSSGVQNMKLPLHQVAKRVTGKIQSGYDPFTGEPFKMVYQRVRKGLGNLEDTGGMGLQFRVQALITDKKSTAQLQSRARLAAAVTAYQTLPFTEKEALKLAALDLHMTGYNLFIKQFCETHNIEDY